MPHIIVDEEQARVIADSTEHVEVRDREGRHIGYVSTCATNEEVEIARCRLAADEPSYTTQEVLDHLKSLDGEVP